MNTRNIENELAAATMIKTALKDMIAADPDFLLDAIEGETNLLECIDKLVISITDAQCLVAGIKEHMDTLTARKARIEDRIDAFRRLITRAMELAEQKKLERPLATLIMSNRQPSLIITNEEAVPTEYLIMKPHLDRKKLKAALDAGELISGAALSNASPSLTIRKS